MTYKQYAFIGIAIAAAVLFLGYSVLTDARFAHADSSGLTPLVATTSVATVNTTASLVFGTSTCTSRTISTTGASGIMLGFTDAQGFVPSGSQGFWQPASTTVAYDAAQYGCKAFRVYSGVSQIITVQEAR